MRIFLIAGAGVMLMSGVAMAQTPAAPTAPSAQTPQGYTQNGPMIGSNGAAVAPNGGLQSGVGTTLANPAAPQSNTTPLGANSGGGASK